MKPLSFECLRIITNGRYKVGVVCLTCSDFLGVKLVGGRYLVGVFIFLFQKLVFIFGK